MNEPRFKIGQTVKYHDKICVVEYIDRSLGWNNYYLRDMETGLNYNTWWQPLQACEDFTDSFDRPDRATQHLQSLWDDDTDEILSMVDLTEFELEENSHTTSPVSNSSANRFALSSEEACETVLKFSTSETTVKQTRWAVRLFKGKIL